MVPIPFGQSERRRLSGFCGSTALRHVLGLGLFADDGADYGAASAGAGSLAYSLLDGQVSGAFAVNERHA